MAVHTDVWTSQVQYELDAARAKIERLEAALGGIMDQGADLGGAMCAALATAALEDAQT